jgi:hypothetical protein
MSKLQAFTTELETLNEAIATDMAAVEAIHAAGKTDAASVGKLTGLTSRLSIHETRKAFLVGKLPFAKLSDLRDTARDLEVKRHEASATAKSIKAAMVEELRPMFGHNGNFKLSEIASLTQTVSDAERALVMALSAETVAQRAAFGQADMMGMARGWDKAELGV